MEQGHAATQAVASMVQIKKQQTPSAVASDSFYILTELFRTHGFLHILIDLLFSSSILNLLAHHETTVSVTPPLVGQTPEQNAQSLPVTCYGTYTLSGH